jgi:ribosomal protein S27E
MNNQNKVRISHFIDGNFIGEYDERPDLLETSGNKFMVGQSYETPAEEIRCLRCGGVEFNVAVGRLFTAIRCPKCKYEICIHEG